MRLPSVGSSTTTIPGGRPAPVAIGPMVGAGMVGEELTAAVGEGRAALALLVTFIHRSAWNRNSANFAFWAFCELRHNGVLRSSHSPIIPQASIKAPP
jgi:hypothetical protein